MNLDRACVANMDPEIVDLFYCVANLYIGLVKIIYDLKICMYQNYTHTKKNYLLLIELFNFNFVTRMKIMSRDKTINKCSSDEKIIMECKYDVFLFDYSHKTGLLQLSILLYYELFFSFGGRLAHTSIIILL